MPTTPEMYEKLGAFYLGREFDLERGEAAAEPLLYDSRDLVTHGLIVGMTGSGKTGLRPRCSKRPRSTACRRWSSTPRATSATSS